MQDKKFSLIEFFISHRLAANLLIAIFILLGLIGLTQLNTRFLPKFSMDTVVISVVWPGASPADVESALTTPIEKQLASLDNVLRMSSVSSLGLSMIVIEFNRGTNMTRASQEIRDRVNLVPNWPAESKPPEVSLVQLYDPVANVIISTQDHSRTLRHWAQQAQLELLDNGVDKVDISGMPDEEIQLTVAADQLLSLQQHLGEIAALVNDQSRDISAGLIKSPSYQQGIRSNSKVQSVNDLMQLPIVSGDKQSVIRLLHLMGLTQQPIEHENTIMYKGQPAIELAVLRSQQTDTLTAAKKLKQWVVQAQKEWPSSVTIHVHFEFWKNIKERINVLLENGTVGLLLILILLFLFLVTRVAVWVAFAVPLSIFGAIFCLWVFNGSINMVSLFALIMTLGIIVDDTIVVAEEGVRLYQEGMTPYQAALQGAQRMWVPIATSSLTTLAAFSPLLFLSGKMGEILNAIPLVVVCVIIASLVECFLILPNHVMKSLEKTTKSPPPRYRIWLDHAFLQVKHHYHQVLSWCMKHKSIVFSGVLVSILLSVGLITSNRLTFSFFPSPDSNRVSADITFNGGVSQKQMGDYLNQVEQAARQADRSLSSSKPLITAMVQYFYRSTEPYDRRSPKRIASIAVELVSPEDRRITNQAFVNAWEQRVKHVPWVEGVRINSSRKGMPGSDIDIAVYGAKPMQLKQAALELQDSLKKYQGVYNITDSMPFAQYEYVFKLNTEAQALGLTTQEIGSQVRAAFNGVLVQTFYKGQDRIDIRLKLKPNDQSELTSLENLPIKTSENQVIPLASLVSIQQQKAFDSLQHLDRRQVITVNAEVDRGQGNTRQIIQRVMQDDLPGLIEKYGVSYELKGRSMEEEQTLREMKVAVCVMLVMIYIILAWASSSYVWPLLVMVAIPLGLQGAIWGHWLLGRELTILSLFGFCGLAGIVINDSIILLFRYKELLALGMQKTEAIVEASCQRMRPVLLTSITTIAGLLPLLFERSMQAQFLIPMAISICFGLLFATVLILVVIPALVSLSEG